VKHYLSIAFKIFILSFTTFGLYLTIQDALNVIEVLSYFTSFVNLLTALLYILFLLNLMFRKLPSDWLYFFKQTLIVFLTLTTIVYSFVLIPYIADYNLAYEIFSLKDIFIHYIVPLIVILDYAWFDKKGHIKYFYIGGNLFTLSAYVFYLITYINLGGRFHVNGVEKIYPYFFLDVQTLGFETFAWIASVILFVVLLLSWVVYQIDHILGVPLNLNQIKRK
jgi:hypothetical protein